MVPKFCRDFGRFIPLPAASDLVELKDGNIVIVSVGIKQFVFLNNE